MEHYWLLWKLLLCGFCTGSSDGSDRETSQRRIKSSSHRSNFLKRFLGYEKRCQQEVKLNEWRINNDQAKSIEIRYKCNTMDPSPHNQNRRNAVSSTWSTVLFLYVKQFVDSTLPFSLFLFFCCSSCCGPCGKHRNSNSNHYGSLFFSWLLFSHDGDGARVCVLAVMVMATVSVMETTYLKSHLCIL